MPRKRLIWQLFPSYLLVTLLSLLALTWYATASWRQFYLEQTEIDLKNRALLVQDYLRGGLSPANGREIDQLCKDLGRLTATRLTVILPSGQVLGDSEENPARMENHADRPEMQEALRGRVGTSGRFSFTLGHQRMYVAIPLKDQGRIAGVVRASLPMTAIAQALRALYWKMALGGLIIVLILAALSLFLSQRISRPLEDLKRGALRFAGGDLSRRLPVPAADELGSLAEAFNHMAEQLEDRINALVRQGQLQEAVLSSMVEGVLAVDAEQRLIALNPAAAKLLGADYVTSQDRSIQEVVRDPQLQSFITRIIFTREPVESEVALRQGAQVIQAHGTFLKDTQGLDIGFLVVLHDVTQLRRLEMTRRDFVANVSHELKTPITSIKGFVETLLAGALREPENAEKFLHIIARQTDRINEIIDDLLSLSRIERDAEQGRVFLSAGKLRGVMESAIQVCAAQAAAKNIAVSLNCPEDLRAQINAPLLEQALVNLIDNAVKYSSPGSAVQVEGLRAGAEVVVRVRDQGVGIEKNQLSRIFERFYRVDAGRSRKVGGTGLGLAIVKHISQALGGRVTVDSTPGKGSSFALHLQAD
ncbi:MAG: cell wall metabolism sensor histidine kinase WalK [Deltaproteobacteria bacterium]|nr:cell wall metabolism sensor histidine kinase WalK [Deltaproteobacteria bacterium]